MIRKLALIVAVAMIPFVFAGCDDDEETTVVYTAGISEMSATGLSFMTEISTITTTYYNALEISDSPFTLTGTVSGCDARVKSACESAEATLSAMAWSGSYVFTVSNVNTGSTVYSCVIGAAE